MKELKLEEAVAFLLKHVFIESFLPKSLNPSKHLTKKVQFNQKAIKFCLKIPWNCSTASSTAWHAEVVAYAK